MLLSGDTQRALGGEVALELRDGLPLLAVRRPSELRLPLRADPALLEAFAAYVAEEIAFAMAHGRLPPVAEGFRLAHGLDAEVPAAAQTAADADVDAFARFLVAQSAIAALADAGWRLEAPPGLPVTATDGAHRLTPSTEIGPGWHARCDAAGVAGLRLAGS